MLPRYIGGSGDHCTMHIEIYGVSRLRLDGLKNAACDALVGVLRYMGRRTRACLDHWNQFVPGGLGVSDESGDRDANVAQIQEIGTARERRKTFALQNVFTTRARGRNGVGLVLETRNQDPYERAPRPIGALQRSVSTCISDVRPQIGSLASGI